MFTCFYLAEYFEVFDEGKLIIMRFLSQVMTTFMAPPPAATFLAFHPQDNNIIAIGMEDSTIQIYNVRIDEVILSPSSSFDMLEFKVWYPTI